MVTKPKPIWTRWLESPEGKEKARLISILAILLLNLFIAIGLVLFFIFLLNR